MRYYDNHDQKSLICQRRFEFMEFKLDPYPKCGHCTSFGIYALFAYHDSLRPKIARNVKKIGFLDKNRVFGPLEVEI